MQRIVGITLLILGFYLFYAVFQAARTSSELKIQSRWMLLISAYKRYFGRSLGRPSKHDSANITGWSSFTIGVLHGLGAETGTQVLLIAAVGGASAHGLSIGMLLAFVVGLILSNTAVALVSTSSFRTSMHLRPLYLFAGGTAGLFSLLVGSVFVLGRAESLPNLVAFKFTS
jgi:high-affinity nickel-transport protein